MSEAAFSALAWLYDWAEIMGRMARSSGNPEKQLCREATAELLDLAAQVST